MQRDVSQLDCESKVEGNRRARSTQPLCPSCFERMVAPIKHVKLIVVSMSLLLTATNITRGQQPWPNGVENCGDISKVLRKSNGNVVWFSPKQMKAMSINRVTPAFPKSCSCEGQSFIAVVVNRQGKVACTRVISGHPLFASASIEASEKWIFKPMIKGGVNVSFVGLLVFTFKSNGAVTY